MPDTLVLLAVIGVSFSFGMMLQKKLSRIPQEQLNDEGLHSIAKKALENYDKEKECVRSAMELLNSCREELERSKNIEASLLIKDIERFV